MEWFNINNYHNLYQKLLIKMYLIAKYYYNYDFNITSTFFSQSNSYQLPCSEDTNVHAQINSTWLD